MATYGLSHLSRAGFSGKLFLFENVLQDISYCWVAIAGKTRARDAALNAVQSPLLDIGIERATGIVWNITGGNDLTLFEVPALLSPDLPTFLLFLVKKISYVKHSMYRYYEPFSLISQSDCFWKWKRTKRIFNQ